MKPTLHTLLLALGIADTSSVLGKILYTTTSSTITLNFNNLNTDFGGAYNATGGSTTFSTAASGPNTIYSGSVNPGLVTNYTDYSPGGVYSNTDAYSNSNSMRAFRDGSSSDLALGLKNFTDQTITLRLQNTTGVTLTSWTVGYVVEQYSKGASATAMKFSYSLNGSSYITTNLTGAADVIANTTAPVDVNLTSVGATARTGTIVESIANNGEIYLRWTYDHISGTSVHLGIDDITVSAIPEPSTYTAILGGLALACVATRRRRRL
jgi:PEP-CTERM motif